MELPHFTWSIFLWVLIPRLLTYLKLNSPNLYYSGMSRCHSPPPFLLKSLLQWFHPPLGPLLYWFLPLLQGLLPCYDFWTGVLFSSPGECFSTNPSFSLGCHGISRFSQSVGVFTIFKLLYHEIEIPKNLWVLEVLCIRRRHPPESWCDITRCPVRSERREGTMECAGLGHWCHAIFMGIWPLYRALWSFFWHSAASRRHISALLLFRGQDGCHYSFHFDILSRRYFVTAWSSSRQVWLAMRSGRLEMFVMTISILSFFAWDHQIKDQAIPV